MGSATDFGRRFAGTTPLMIHDSLSRVGKYVLTLCQMDARLTSGVIAPSRQKATRTSRLTPENSSVFSGHNLGHHGRIIYYSRRMNAGNIMLLFCELGGDTVVVQHNTFKFQY